MNLKLLPIYVLVLFLCILQNQPATTNHGPSMQPNVPTQARKGTRELGIKVGVLPRGTLNSITDVSGVMVGHRTIIKGEDVRTGVTAILPHSGNIFLGEGSRSGFCWQWLRQTNRIDAGRRAGRD